ncbi:MAG: hypothetical protein IIW24_03570 [Lachnospiraceae bacterium]|nr:hypothetical protein [Lachnospiraceae bacterium]
MSRFEEAKESPMVMAIMIAFCIAAYLEKLGIHEFSDDGLKKFMSEISTDIEEWLEEESEVRNE